MVTVVPTGGMVIARHGLLKAFLGSCIGLALYDSKASLGGILHILLPEPVSGIPESHRTYYARTGIPIFIDEMRQQGATAEDISAFVAGGALVDPLSPQDMILNITHQSLDITLSFLKKSGIAIKMLEASGVNPFCIALDVETGKCVIEPVITDKEMKDDPVKHVTMDEIEDTIEKLLPVPQMAFSVANMLSDDSIDISSIAGEIKKDQVLSAKILGLCNSAFIGLPRKIASIDHAILYLGSKLLLQVVLTAQLENMYTLPERGYSLCRGGMFHHALATARLSKTLAKALGKVDPDVAYTAGLLHDIGKVVLDQYIAKVKPLFYRMMIEHKEDSCVLERQILGFDHCQAGLVLAESWDLPDVLKDVILFHHAPDTAEYNREIVNLVYVSDIFAGKFLPGLELEKIDTAGIQAGLKSLGLDPQVVYDNLNVIADPG
ncbi:MAG TPA: HDOD domain-containing protein [Deltaproteobacteria bacterium]|nr:HDOD domain-containing protein [Deltaproteobacteria bacterium]HQJ08695.1 HDOD domain-containing protein [Deltaproteobacteria bacterium]